MARLFKFLVFGSLHGHREKISGKEGADQSLGAAFEKGREGSGERERGMVSEPFSDQSQLVCCTSINYGSRQAPPEMKRNKERGEKKRAPSSLYVGRGLGCHQEEGGRGDEKKKGSSAEGLYKFQVRNRTEEKTRGKAGE